MGKNSHFCLEMGGLSKSVTVMFRRRCVAAFLCQGSKHFITINQPVSDIFAKLIRRPPIHFKTAFKVASLVQLYNLKHYYGVSLNGSTFEVPILSNLVAMAIEQESSLTLEAKKDWRSVILGRCNFWQNSDKVENQRPISKWLQNKLTKTTTGKNSSL